MEEHKLSRLQEAELEILKTFIEICEEHHLRYFLCYGSMIGAVRHQGFVPWDDDVDVAMPRPDYDRFAEIADKALPPDLYYSTYKMGVEHITLSSMIMSKDKAFTLNNASKIMQTGAWIDVLAIDGAPKPGIGRKIFFLKYMYRRTMCQLAHFDEIVSLQKKRPWYEKAVIKFAQITKIERLLDGAKCGEKYHRLISRIPYDEADEVASFQTDDKFEGIVPKSVYGKGTKYKFEDIYAIGPDDYDRYLKCYYPDYMTPPSMELRNRHNVKEAKK